MRACRPVASRPSAFHRKVQRSRSSAPSSCSTSVPAIGGSQGVSVVVVMSVTVGPIADASLPEVVRRSGNGRVEPHRAGAGVPAAAAGQPGDHRREAGGQARRLRPGRPPLREHPARGRHPGGVHERPLRRLPPRPRAAATTASVPPRRGARPGHGRARRPPRRRRRHRPGRQRPWQDRPCPAAGGGHPGPGGPPHHAPAPDRGAARPDPGTTTELVRACSERRRVRLGYRTEAGSEWLVEVDPWAVVVRHGRWYLLCHSHAADARRAYRVDRVHAVELLVDTFTPPADLDPVGMLEDHLAVGWEYDVEVVIDAPVESATRCLPRALGRVEALDEGTCRLVGSTSNPVWYAQQLTPVPAAYRVVRCPELQEAAHVLGQRLLAAATGGATLP